MTYRERRTRRAARLREWAEGRQRKATAAFQRSDAAVEGIPMGQPILVGHHSEGRHRRALDKSHNAMRAGIDSEQMAARHNERADNIEAAAGQAIYSDDPDAIEQLRARIQGLEDERQHMKDINKAIRAFEKRSGIANANLTAANLTECGCTTTDVRRFWPELYGWRFPPYAMSNLSGNIGRQRKRLESLGRREAAVTSITNLDDQAKRDLVVRQVLGKGETYAVDLPEICEDGEVKRPGASWGYFDTQAKAAEWLSQYQ